MLTRFCLSVLLYIKFFYGWILFYRRSGRHRRHSRAVRGPSVARAAGRGHQDPRPLHDGAGHRAVRRHSVPGTVTPRRTEPCVAVCFALFSCKLTQPLHLIFVCCNSISFNFISQSINHSHDTYTYSYTQLAGVITAFRMEGFFAGASIVGQSIWRDIASSFFPCT
jgi:hypothetical protein